MRPENAVGGEVTEETKQAEPGIHPKLTNPLSDETRKERLYLLGMSAIGVTIVFTGLIPTEIRTLGIAFAEADRTSLLLIFALVIAYFLAAFVSYALSDYVDWYSAREELSRAAYRKYLQEQREKLQRELAAMQGADDQSERDATESGTNPYRYGDEIEISARLNKVDEYEEALGEASGASFALTSPIVTLRFAFDFLLPPIVGLFAIGALLIKAL